MGRARTVERRRDQHGIPPVLHATPMPQRPRLAKGLVTDDPSLYGGSPASERTSNFNVKGRRPKTMSNPANSGHFRANGVRAFRLFRGSPPRFRPCLQSSQSRPIVPNRVIFHVPGPATMALAVPFEYSCGNSIQLPFHEQLTSQTEPFSRNAQSR